MALKRVEVEIYVWDGLITEQPTTPAYTINKSVISGQTNITLEIAELVRDYLTVTFNNDYLSVARYVNVLVNSFDEGDEPFETNPITSTYIALDGYGYFEDGTNPELERHALISANDIYLPENTAGKLPIFAEGVGKVVIDGVTTQIIDGGSTGADNSTTPPGLATNPKVQYIDIPANSSTVQVYDTDDSTLKKTITVTNICEPKFTPYKVTFCGKHGSFVDLYFFKKSNEKLDIRDETFKTNTIANSTSTYQTHQGQKERYNVNGTTSLTLNTGFVSEEMNKTLEELFLTENVWIRYEGKTLPVIPKSKTMDFKTSVNDRLANYTIDFEFAFDKINSVR